MKHDDQLNYIYNAMSFATTITLPTFSWWLIVSCLVTVVCPQSDGPSLSSSNNGPTPVPPQPSSTADGFISEFWGSYHSEKWRNFPESERLKCKESARKMFYFGYDSYMRHAFPQDELNPIDCTGRGPDVSNPLNLNINDVLGNFSLTLVDSLDTLAILGNSTEFKNAVKIVTEQVHFDLNSTVQVFETTIRVLGSLLSAHLLTSILCIF